MQCREAVFAEDVLIYVVDNYRGEGYVREVYNPDCYIRLDDRQAIIYQQVQNVNGEAIQKYGFSAIPNVFGLMSEEALEASGVLRIRRQPSLDLYGQGVLIGIVDTGIDFTHKAFVAADGTSRIVSIWDQSVEEGVGNEKFPYGRMYSREQLNQALSSENPFEIVPSQDEIGHGTFMAGVAAGNENRAEEFSGVAPLSELVVVKCRQANESYRNYYRIPSDVPAYLESDVMTGLAYLLSVAAQERKPIILCLGMGSSMGNHNGSTALGVYLNRYLSVGSVAIVTCVGNEGNTRHHHTIRRKEDTIDISVSANMNGFMGQLWWQTPGSLSVDVISPSGETIRKVRTQFDYEVPNFSMWLPIQQFLEKEVVFLDPDPDMTATNPSTTPFVTGVSAYDVRDGALYLQSGRGFTPFGYIKPEVVAPGVELTGTYPGNRYGTMTGTSVAAAFVAGISALFMQEYADDGANSNTVREALIRGAVPRGEPYPNTEWGYGIVDAYRSITDY